VKAEWEETVLNQNREVTDGSDKRWISSREAKNGVSNTSTVDDQRHDDGMIGITTNSSARVDHEHICRMVETQMASLQFERHNRDEEQRVGFSECTLKEFQSTLALSDGGLKS
jgi:hypothetical protein